MARRVCAKVCTRVVREWQATQQRNAATIKVGGAFGKDRKAGVAVDHAVGVPDVVDAKILRVGAGVKAKTGITAIVGLSARVP